MYQRMEKVKTSLKHMNHNKLANRGKVPQWPEREEELKNWIIERRRVDKRQVSIIAIRLRAKLLSQGKGFEHIYWRKQLVSSFHAKT